MARSPLHQDRAQYARVLQVDENNEPVTSVGGSIGATDATIVGPLPLPVVGPLTDGELRASPISVAVGSIVLAPGAATESTLAAIGARTPSLGSALATASVPSVLSDKFTFAGTQYAAGTAVLNRDLLTGALSGWLNVSTYNSAVLTITTGAGISAGAVQFEETNDTTIAPNGTIVLAYNTVTQNVNPISAVSLAASQTTSVYLPLRARFFRCRVSTAVAGGTVQAAITLSQLPFAPTNQTINQATAASLNATIAAIPVGTSLIGDVGIQNRANSTGASSVTSVMSPATAATATIKASTGRLLGWQLINSAATLRSVKIFNATAPTLGTTAAIFEIDLLPGTNSTFHIPGGIGFATAMTYIVTAGKGLTNNDSTGLVANDVSGSFFFA